MDILASGAPVYFIAGTAVGVAVTMLVFAIAVGLDRARLRRGIRRARAAASIAPAAAETTAPATDAAVVSPQTSAAEAGSAVEPDPSTSPPSGRKPTVEELFAEAFRTATETPPEQVSSDPAR